jgi:hypothetical protein
MSNFAVQVPHGARCLGCHYDLRGLHEPHCPECGREFDPADNETMALPGQSAVTRAPFVLALVVLYAWPLLAAVMLWAGSAWDRNFIIYRYVPLARATVANWFWSASLWNTGVWMWVALLATWVVRIVARRSSRSAESVKADRDRRDRPARRFACACFIIVMLLISSPQTDRCSHGEYWELWHTVGLEREVGGGFCDVHVTWCVPLGRGWHLYWRR